MPIDIASGVLDQGWDAIQAIPFLWPTLKALPLLALLWLLKTYFGGARNTSERNMHSKVVMMTGATSGIGASVAYNLAQRGAQLVLLTQYPLDDPFLSDYILDLRASTDNDLITAIQCDLSSLHSIRLFATKWVDNSPPRRLDMIILCANTMTPKGSDVQLTEEGVESNYGINYLANFHLLSILSPAIRAQPPDRDVRIIFATCPSYMGGQIPETVPRPSIAKAKAKKEATYNPTAAYAVSKLCLMTFTAAFQKHIASYVRPDKQPMNARVLMVDPGWCRTPGMRRYLTRGSLLGLGIYLLMWPFWWLVLKSPEQGAQTFLFAAMEAEFERREGGMLLKEVMETKIYREEVTDEKCQKRLWQVSEKAVEALEKEGAQARAREKGEKEAKVEEDKKQAQGKPEVKEGSRRSKKAAAKEKSWRI